MVPRPAGSSRPELAAKAVAHGCAGCAEEGQVRYRPSERSRAVDRVAPQQTGRHGTDQDNGVLDPRRSTVAVRTRLASFGCQRVHGPSGPVAYAAAGCALSRTGFLGYSKASSSGRGRSRTACTSRGRSRPQSRPDGLVGRHRAGSSRARPRPARHRHPRRPVMTGEPRTLRHARRTVHPTAVDTRGRHRGPG